MPAYRIALGDEVMDIPLYDPAEVEYNALRVSAPDGSGDVLAPRLIPDPEPTRDQALRIGLDGDVYAISLAETRILEDFEDGVWPGSWTGDTGAYQLVEPPYAISGDYSLTPQDVSDDPDVVNTHHETPRGHTYSALIRPDGTDPRPRLLTSVQDPMSAHANLYAAELRVDLNDLRVVRLTDWSGTELALTPVDAGLVNGTDYRVVLDVGEDTLRGRVLTEDGEELAATDTAVDTTHDGGYLGLFAREISTRFDELARHPLNTNP